MEPNTTEASPPPLPEAEEADLDAWLAQGGDAEDSSDGEDEYSAWLDGALGAARTRLQRAKAEELRLDRRLSGAEESDWSRFVQQKNELMEDVTKEAQQAQAEARAIIDAADLCGRRRRAHAMKGDFRPPAGTRMSAGIGGLRPAVEFMKADVKIAPRRPAPSSETRRGVLTRSGTTLFVETRAACWSSRSAGGALPRSGRRTAHGSASRRCRSN